MIITPTLAYYGPPKTGSTAVRRWLGGEMHSGQNDYIPSLVQNRVLFCTLRNPFVRAASLWKHYLREHPESTIDFEPYLETSISGIDWPQSWWLREHDFCLDVRELGIPVVNQTTAPVPWTRRAVRLVKQRYVDDFDLCAEWRVDCSEPMV